ncbi:MAG: acyltransferase, family [Nocardia sp.]|uniref:wax ester/triacylglycerol synthase domain-containing protein n=1 Tax=Nocardia sp. TaxID=1821 RepID=UPI002616CCF3|nr:wax ester/triacylglycerol synthase domain-containing protein [Nocardia sp.]MCU1643003.1 acyltransferase, family [Nocardia sp.]
MTDLETNTVDNLAAAPSSAAIEQVRPDRGHCLSHLFLQAHVVTPGDLITTNDVHEVARPKVIPRSVNSGRPKQLSPLDTQLLDMGTPTTPMHVGAVIMLASNQPLDIMTLRCLVADRLYQAAPLRRRLQRVPLGLDRPYWEESSSIDLGYHIRAATLPSGATDRDLAGLVALTGPRELVHRV